MEGWEMRILCEGNFFFWWRFWSFSVKGFPKYNGLHTHEFGLKDPDYGYLGGPYTLKPKP